MAQSHRVIVVNFGGAYAHQTAREVFLLGYPVTLLNNDSDLLPRLNYIIDANPEARLQIVLPGCDMSFDPTFDMRVLELGLPVLGICNGFQLIALGLDGSVGDIPAEIGTVDFIAAEMGSSGLLAGLPRQHSVVMSHHQIVTSIPSLELELLGSTSQSPIAAFASRDGRFIGFQFHPEAPGTTFGRDILKRVLAGNIGDSQVFRRRWSNSVVATVDRLGSWQLAILRS